MMTNSGQRRSSKRVFLSVLFASIAAICLGSTAARGAGILVPSGRSRDVESSVLRIVDHLVSAQIRNGIALTTINQTFENTTNQRLEGTYIFPIPEGADITDFQMMFNGKMVQGEVLPADQAKKIYEDIVRRQRDPGLIEFIGRRLLKARVFPIEPHSKTEIQISYQQVIDQVSGMSRYRYPLRTPGTSGHAYGTVRFSVDLETKGPLKAVWSPTHSVEVVRDGEHRAKAVFEKSGVSLDEDFLLLYDTDDQDVGMSLVAHKGKGDEAGHFLMILSPKDLWDDDVAVPQDYVFVVDTSGSMAGDKIAQARKALSYCVKRLEEGDRFNVVRFSTGFDLVFDGLRSAAGDAKEEALKAIKKFKAAGGTNIYGALEQAIGMYEKGDSQRPFVVVFLTDGLGDRDREEIEQMLAEKTGGFRSEIRLFPFGVGHDVNTKLLDSLATKYGGMPTYVQPGEDLEDSLGDFFAVFSQPVLTDVKIALPDDAGVTDRFPPAVGDMYHGRQLVLAGQYEKGVSGRVVLTGRRGDEKVRYEWDDVSFASTGDKDDESDYVSRIWAGRKIAYLLDRIRLNGESDEMVDEVVKLATRYGIQTPYTSWLVAPEGRDKIRLGFDGGRGGGGAQASAPADASVRYMRRSAGKGWADSFGAASGRAARVAEESRGMGEGGGVNPGDIPASPDSLGALDLDDESGERAVKMAKTLSELREGDSLDASAGNSRAMVMRHINGRDYWNIGGVLVDAEFAEDTETIDVKFGSDAYFDIVMNRDDLRKVFSSAKYLIVMVSDDIAVFVQPTTGVEELTDEMKAKVLKK